MDATTKTCTACGETKALEDFNRRAASRDGRQPRCRLCAKQWHLDHREERLRAIRERHQRVLAENRERLLAYLRQHPCVDCGEADPVVLEFDHRDRASKRSNLCTLLADGYAWEAIAAEMAKCDVRCCNCHRIRTIAQMGWWRGLFAGEGEAL